MSETKQAIDEAIVAVNVAIKEVQEAILAIGSSAKDKAEDTLTNLQVAKDNLVSAVAGLVESVKQIGRKDNDTEVG